MQLDLFDDSGAVAWRNDAAAALLAGDLPAARRARERLAAGWPGDEALPAIDRLADALARGAPARFADHRAAAAQAGTIEHELAPAAGRLFGQPAAGAWIAARWREAALAAAALPWQHEHPDVHAAAFWLAAGEPQAAADAAASIPSARRIPAPLAWLAESRGRLHGLDAAWQALAELACLAPARFEAVARRLAEPRLDALRARFAASFEGEGGSDDLAWFPAWLLVEQPALLARLREAETPRATPPEQALRTLVELLGYERQGRQHDIAPLRRRLRDLHPGLFAAYMAQR